MGRINKEKSAAPQTAETLNVVAQQIEGIAAELRAAVEILKLHNPNSTMKVPYDASRRDGLWMLRTWVSAVRKEVDDLHYRTVSAGVSGKGQNMQETPEKSSPIPRKLR